MEHVDQDEHPLALENEEASPLVDPLYVSTNNDDDDAGVSLQPQSHFRSYRTPSASLIQTAVRSVLDDATPSTIISDDQSEASFVNGGSASPGFRKKKETSPTLESLQKEKLPPMPDEQDRKRFIVSEF